ncbi:MAG: Na+/H+ antiporter NhaC family protein [Bacteroidota bacterium]
MNKIILIFSFLLLFSPGFSEITPDSSKAGSKQGYKNIEIFITGQEQGKENKILDDRLNIEDISVELPGIIIKGLETQIRLQFNNPEHPKLTQYINKIEFLINGIPQNIAFEKGKAAINYIFNEEGAITIAAEGFTFKKYINPIPLWLSILPPLIAILMALVFREVITSLFIGIFIGSATIGYYSNGLTGIFSGLLSVIDTYIISSLNNWAHLAIIIFSMVIGAIVSVIIKNGGMQGVVNKISIYAKDARSGQLATWFLGIAIFFDDYANTLVVGNTMRPITDKLKISREKLSYIVDSTAAPVASIAFVTTWIGAELGYIETSIKSIEVHESAYSIFINSLQYAFYPVFTLIFILMLIFKGRDFGAMLKAEVRARTTGIVGVPHRQPLPDPSRSGGRPSAEACETIRTIKDETVNESKFHSNQDRNGISKSEIDDLQPVGGIQHRWFNAVIPIAVVIFGTIFGLFYTGWNVEIWNNPGLSFARKLSAIIGESNSYYALLWASLCGLLTAILLTLGQKIMSITNIIDASLKGFKTMLNAIMILILAWSLALVTEHMHTANFITNTLLSGGLDPVFIPAITFIIAGLIAFSTGSSWGTMAILYPLMLSASWQLCKANGYDFDSSMMIFYNVVSCVLAGSVLGDHCSPISDTTILSSLASSCNHIDHVRTQLPYALTVGCVAIFCGTIPGALGISSLITFPVGLIVLYLIVNFAGEKVLKDG